MIVCANGWSSHVEALEHEEDAEWLHSNSIVVQVRVPLWVRTDEDV